MSVCQLQIPSKCQCNEYLHTSDLRYRPLETTLVHAGTHHSVRYATFKGHLSAKWKLKLAGNSCIMHHTHL